MPAFMFENITPETIEATLVGIHNEVVPGATTDGFDGGKNAVSGPDSVEIFAPHPNDKADLLKLAVELSGHEKDTRELAAMRVGAAVLVVHPFYDGNGRTSRVMHAKMLGYSNDEIQGMGIATPHAEHGEDYISVQARKKIDLKPPYPFPNFLYSEVYAIDGLEKVHFRTTLDDDDKDRAIYEEVKARVDADRAQDLDIAYCIKPKTYQGVNPVDRDSNAVEYALNKLRSSGVKVVTKQRITFSDGARCDIVDIPRMLSALDDDQLQSYVDATWEYRRKYAELAIRCLSADEIGQQVDTLHDITSTIAEHYIRLSNNLVRRTVTTAS